MVQANFHDFETVHRAFEKAHQLKPSDTNVLLVLGTLNFLQRDYDKARDAFAAAIKENPTDHSLWNKYGAALSNGLQTKEAIGAYE